MKTALTLVLLLVTSGAPAAAAGQGAGGGEQAEAARLNAEVVRLYREGKFDEALPLARRVLELREKALGPDDLAVASALNNLAAIHTRRQKNGEAEQLLRRSLAIAEKRAGAESEFAADVVGQLGRLRLEAADYKEAAVLLQRALSAKQKLHGASSPALVPVLFNLTDLNFLRGQPASAYASLDHALTILEAQPPRKDPATASRLKTYYCPLMSRDREGPSDLSGRIGSAIWRLEEPEKAAESEKRRREREARGERELTAVEAGVLNGRAVSKPQPDYPRLAKDQRVSGVVVVKIMVDESGKVIDAEALCGHPVLARASVDAARKARFTPTLLSGAPVKVTGIITYNFIMR